MKTFDAVKTWVMMEEMIDKETDDEAKKQIFMQMGDEGLKEYPQTEKELKESMKKIVDRAEADLKKRQDILKVALQLKRYVADSTQALEELFKAAKAGDKNKADVYDKKIMDNIDRAKELTKNIDNKIKEASESKDRDFITSVENLYIQLGLPSL